MALKLQYLTEHGVTCSSGFHRIQYIRLMQDSEGTYMASFAVETYLTEGAYETGYKPLETRYYTAEYDAGSSDNPFTQMYNYLKSLSEYKGAIDAE